MSKTIISENVRKEAEKLVKETSPVFEGDGYQDFGPVTDFPTTFVRKYNKAPSTFLDEEVVIPIPATDLVLVTKTP